VGWQSFRAKRQCDQRRDPSAISQVKYVVDTGPLAAFLNRNEKNKRLRNWAAQTLQSVRWPLYTNEPVLTETAYWLGTAVPLLEMVEAGDLIVGLTLEDHTADLRRIIERYSGKNVSLADAALVRMVEIWRESTVITIDRNNFSAYRRFGRDPITFLAPPV
jgi:predicted nucleic acid-binding protein